MERVLCITKDDFLGLPRVKASLLQDPRGLPVKAALLFFTNAELPFFKLLRAVI